MTVIDETADEAVGVIDETAGETVGGIDETIGGRTADVGPPGAEVDVATKRVLLIWDAPNLDMGLGAILGGRPTAAHRPRFDALGRWLLARTAELAAGCPEVSCEPEATVFTNIAPGSAEVVRPWVEALRNVGFAVFAKPKVYEDSDVDDDMLAHIAARRAEGLASVLVASADGQAFRAPLEELASSGTPATVLGFREHASWALASDSLEFVDLEEIPGVFREPLPRIGLDSLPEHGAWLQPFRPLSSLLTSRL